MEKCHRSLQKQRGESKLSTEDSSFSHQIRLHTYWMSKNVDGRERRALSRRDNTEPEKVEIERELASATVARVSPWTQGPQLLLNPRSVQELSCLRGVSKKHQSQIQQPSQAQISPESWAGWTSGSWCSRKNRATYSRDLGLSRSDHLTMDRWLLLPATVTSLETARDCGERGSQGQT